MHSDDNTIETIVKKSITIYHSLRTIINNSDDTNGNKTKPSDGLTEQSRLFLYIIYDDCRLHRVYYKSWRRLVAGVSLRRKILAH